VIQTAAQKIDNGQSTQVTGVPALPFSILGYTQLKSSLHECWFCYISDSFHANIWTYTLSLQSLQTCDWWSNFHQQELCEITDYKIRVISNIQKCGRGTKQVIKSRYSGNHVRLGSGTKVVAHFFHVILIIMVQWTHSIACLLMKHIWRMVILLLQGDYFVHILTFLIIALFWS
jgi:hypothetical protein